jgi:hypothetical protein
VTASATADSRLMPRTSARPCNSQTLPLDCTQRLLRAPPGGGPAATAGPCLAAAPSAAAAAACAPLPSRSTSQLQAAAAAESPAADSLANLVAAAAPASKPSATGPPGCCWTPGRVAPGSLLPAEVLPGEGLSESDGTVTTAVSGPALPWVLRKLPDLSSALLRSSADVVAAWGRPPTPLLLLRTLCGTPLQQPPQHSRQQRRTLCRKSSQQPAAALKIGHFCCSEVPAGNACVQSLISSSTPPCQRSPDTCRRTDRFPQLHRKHISRAPVSVGPQEHRPTINGIGVCMPVQCLLQKIQRHRLPC